MATRVDVVVVNLKTIRRRRDKGDFPNSYRSATRASSPWLIPVTDLIASGLTPGKPAAEEPAPATNIPTLIRLPETAARVFIAEYLDDSHNPGRYGSHRRRNQSKLAVVLQLLHDPTARTVNPMFWDLAETIVDGSDSVYGLIDAAAAHDQAQTTEAAGRKQAHIARVVDDDKVGRALAAQARYVGNKCHASPGTTFTRKELQKATRSTVHGVSRKELGGLDAIITRAIEQGWITEIDGHYSAGTNRP